jgi:hypothetical protein
MPWYKIDLSFGPGSQGHDTVYKWSSYELPPDEERELVHAAIDENPYASNAEYGARGKSILVSKLPEDVRQEKMNELRNSIKHAEEMLLILEKES